MDSPFHAGEREMQRRAGVAGVAHEIGRIIRDRIGPAAARAVARQRFAILSSLDRDGRVWASLLTGPAGFVTAIDEQLLRIAADPAPGDPLIAALAARPELGVLLIDPETRQRIRLSGRAIRQADGLYLLVAQVYGNCPKYIQRRTLDPAPRHTSRRRAAGAPRVADALNRSQQRWIAHADTFFIASFHPDGGADASHRGGRPGFVRVLGARRLAFADYSGNGMFSTLGNLVAYPHAGLVFVDFETGSVLHLTGRARVGADFGVTFDVDEVRARRAGCALRGRLLEPWPGNPPLSHAGPAGI